MIVETFWGQKLDVDRQIWLLDGRFKLDFGKTRAWSDDACAIADAFKAFLIHCAKRERPRSVATYFIIIEFALRDPDVRASIPEPDESFILAVARRFQKSRKTLTARMSLLRRWYRFAEAEGFDTFDADAAMIMDAMVIRMPRIGTAVMREDPRHGPLSEGEYNRLITALWRARAEKSVPLQALVATLLMINFGVNRENLMQLKERDLSDRRNAEGYRLLDMPRIKKRVGATYGTHKGRPLVPEMEGLLEELIASNRANYPLDLFPDSDVQPRPLFIRTRTEHFLSPTLVAKEYFYNMTRELPDKLGVYDDTDAGLYLYPRRLRYTFASREVARGRSIEELQELLDHSDLDCLLIYYNPRWDLVPRLDETVGPELTAFVDMAMGRRQIPAQIAPGLAAQSTEDVPYACLTCRAFRPVKATALNVVAKTAAERVATLRKIPQPALAKHDVELAAWQQIIEQARRATSAIERLAVR